MEQYNYGWLADSRAGLASAADSSKAVIDTKGDLSADWIGKSTDQMFHAADLMARPAREKAFNEELMKINEQKKQDLLGLEQQFIKTAFEDGKKDIMDIQSLESTGFTYDQAVDNITKRVRNYGFDTPTQLMYALTAPNAKYNPALSQVRNDYNLMANLEALKLIERKRDALDSGAISSQDMMMLEESMRSRSPYGYEQGVKGFINEQMKASSNIMQNAKTRMDNSYQMMANADVNHKEFYGNNPDGSDEMMPTTGRRSSNRNIMNTNVSVSGNIPTDNQPNNLDMTSNLPNVNELRKQVEDQTGVKLQTTGFSSTNVDKGHLGGWLFGWGSDDLLDNNAIGEIYKNSSIADADKPNAIFNTLDRDRIKYVLQQTGAVKSNTLELNNKSGTLAGDISKVLADTFKGDLSNVTPETIEQFSSAFDALKDKHSINSKGFNKVKDSIIKDIKALNAMHIYEGHPVVQTRKRQITALYNNDKNDPFVQRHYNEQKVTADNNDLNTNVVPTAKAIMGGSPSASQMNEAFIIANGVGRLAISQEAKNALGSKILEILQEYKDDENALQDDFWDNIQGKINSISEEIYDWEKDYNKGKKSTNDHINLGKGIAGPNGTNVDAKMLLKQILGSMIATYDYDKKNNKLVYNKDKAVAFVGKDMNNKDTYRVNPASWALMAETFLDPELYGYYKSALYQNSQ